MTERADSVSATMMDVARLAGVSLKSVSNYFNDYPHMTDELRDRICAAAAELDFRVNQSARSLRSGRTSNIALVVPELSQIYFANLAENVIAAARQQGFNVSILTTGNEAARELDVLTGKIGPAVDGIIFETVALAQREIPFDQVRCPLVLIGERVEDAEVDRVSMDNVNGAMSAVNHLLERGRRRIVALGYGPESRRPSAASRRFEGYERALREAGIEPDPELVATPASWRWPDGGEAMAALMESGVEFDAVFAFCDALAFGAMAAVQRAGKTVPTDVAVVGFDNVEESAATFPSLTTVDPGRSMIASSAVGLLLDRIRGERPRGGEPQHVVASHHIVVRGSSS